MDWVSYPVFERFIAERRRLKAPPAEEVVQSVLDFPSIPEEGTTMELVRYDYHKNPGYLKMGRGSNSIQIPNAMEPLTEIPRAFDGVPNFGFLIPVPESSDSPMAFRNVWDYVTDQLGDDFRVVSTGSAKGPLNTSTLYVGETVGFRAYSGACSGHKACNHYYHFGAQRHPDDKRHEELATALKEHREQEAYLPMKNTLS
jgi:hypothetical protein